MIWITEFPGAVTVCDRRGVSIEIPAAMPHFVREG
jgi:hypothetical protein